MSILKWSRCGCAVAAVLLILSGCGGGGGGPDTTAPVVDSITPADAATGVAKDTTIEIVFNEAMDEATLDDTTITLEETVSTTAVAYTSAYDSGTRTYTITPDATLTTYLQYTVTVTTGVTDTAGNALAADVTATFRTVDDVDPTTPGTPTDDGDYDDATVTFDWTAATDADSGMASYVIEIGTTAGGNDVYSGDVGLVLTYDFDATTEEGSTLYARVAAVDGEGNQGAWSGNSDGIMVDTVAPTAPGTPTDAGVYDNTTVTFDWTAATDASSGVASYVLEIGTTAGGNDVFNGNVGNVLTYDATGAEGQTLYARVAAVDAAGLQGAWSGNSDGVTVDTVLPTAPGTPTDAGDYDDTTVTFNWTAATDATSGVASYVLQVGTTAGGNDIYDGNVGNVLTYDATASEGDTVYARVAAVDGAGNQGPWSGNSDGILVDTLSPTAPGTPTDNGTYDNLSVTFNWTASDDGANGSGIAAYTLYIGTSPGASDVFDLSIGNVTTYVLDATGLEGFTLYARVMATDAAGHSSSWSGDSDGVTVDATGPTVPGTPTDAGVWTTASVVFNWTAATDATSGIGSYVLQVGTTAGGNDVFNGNVGNVLTYTVTGSNGNTLYARVAAVDGAGNQGLWSGNSDGITVDTAGPTAPGTPADDGDYDDSTVTFTWTAASDGGSGVASYVLQVGTTAGGNDVLDMNVGNVLTYDATGTEGQTLYARVVAIDSLGNVGTWSGNSNGIMVDELDPTAPGTPTDAGTYDNDPVTFDWTAATDAASGVASYVLQVGTAPGASNIFDGNVGNVLTYNVPSGGWHGATFYARVAAVDAAGHQGSWSGDSDGVVIDLQAPVVFWASPSWADVSLAQNIEIQFSEPMDQASVEAAGAFTLAPAAANGYLFYWNATGDMVTIVPDTQNPVGPSNNDLLLEEQSYSASLIAGVTDVAGNPIGVPVNWFFDTRDATPPYLVSGMAGGNNLLNSMVDAADVEDGDTIVFMFSEEIQNQGRIEMRGSDDMEMWAEVGGGGDGASVVYIAPNQLWFTLERDLVAGGEYRLWINGINDVVGNWMESDDIVMQVAANPSIDTTSPQVTATIPLDGAVGVGRMQPIVIAFSESIAKDTIADITVGGGGLSIADFDVMYEGSNEGMGTMVILEPYASMPASAVVTVIIPTTLEDLAGNALSPAYTLDFTTDAAADAGRPTIGVTIPFDGETNAQTWGDVMMAFEDSVSGNPDLLNPDTLDDDDFLIVERDTGLPLRGWVPELDEVNVVRLVNRGGMGMYEDTWYDVYAGPGIHDMEGNSMLAMESFGFRTAITATENVTPYLNRPVVRITGKSSPAGRALSLRLEIRDQGGMDETVSFADRVGGVSVTSTWSTETEDYWDYWGGDHWQFRYGEEGGPVTSPEPGMTDLNYPTSGFYTYDISVMDDLMASTAYTADAWVWTPVECPTLGTVDGAPVNPAAAILTTDSTPSFTWTSDTVNTDYVGLYAVEVSQLGGDVPGYFTAQIMDPSLQTYTLADSQALPTGVYLWVIVQSKTGPKLGDSVGEGWSLDPVSMQLEPFFVYGQGNPFMLDNYGAGTLKVNVDDTGAFVNSNGFSGSYLFDGVTNMFYNGLDADSNPAAGTELFATDPVTKDLVITENLMGELKGWQCRGGSLLMDVQAANTRGPAINLATRRYDMATVPSNAMDGEWVFIMIDVDETGGVFNGAFAATGIATIAAGTVNMVGTRNDGTPYVMPLPIAPILSDGFVEMVLEGPVLAQGYIGGDGPGQEIVVLSGVLSMGITSNRRLVVFARDNHALAGADNTIFSGEYKFVDYELRQDAVPSLTNAWCVRGTAIADGMGNLDVSLTALDGSKQSMSAPYMVDGVTETVNIAGMWTCRAGPDADTIIGVDLGDPMHAAILVISK
ncbi:MAG: Ig-like domain-containing protein [Planctomycetes bacterium]|nr:Ig-like domain-containing protein [Planctomycetota bacterium]